MGNFITGDTALPSQKTDQFAPTGASYELDAADINSLINALSDTRDHLHGSWVNPLSSAYGAKMDGATDDSAALVLAAAAAASQGKALFIPGKLRVASGTPTVNVPIMFGAGGSFDLRGGTLTTNAPLVASPAQQIFFMNGGTLSINRATNRVGYSEWFGGFPGGTDCLAALGQATSRFPVTQLQGYDYYTTARLTLGTSHSTLRGHSKHWDNSQNVTRLIVQSATEDVLLVGSTSNPGSVNAFLKEIRLENLELTRDRAVTPPTAGQEISGAAGVRVQFTEYCYFDHVKASEHTNGYVLSGTVQAHLRDCFAFRSLAGNSATNDVFAGYFLNGNASIGLAGGNASTYITDCTASVGGAPPLSDSTGFNLVGKPVDTFLFRPECTALNTGISIAGDSSAGGNADVHVINPIIDQFGIHGILIVGVGAYGVIDISNGYMAPVSGNTSTYGIRVLNSTGMVALTNNQTVNSPNVGCIGLMIDGSKGVVARSNMHLEAARPIALSNASNCVVEDVICNPSVTATEGAVWMSGSTRNYIAPVIKGGAALFPIGIQAVSTGNGYNEFNCTGIDSAAVASGSANKLTINGVQIVATGASGTNLVSGVMA